ncbi:hypothetical protein [Ferruginibacter sp. SUN106]|uniref:hypothetical protein n=1 Tax=Ferruginibacter sp. SUN106 TaxID=2978348 RepID=UPI003D36FB27
MTEDIILIDEIIGKTITDIRCKYGEEDGWLDTAECFIQLDNKFYIDIPYGQVKDVLVVEPGPEAETVFGNLSDIPYYHVNKEGKSIAEVAEAHKKRKQNIFNRIRKLLFGYEPPIEKYTAYKVEYHENKLKYIINRTITDYLWENDRIEKGFFELDNGYFISDQYMAPQGTGLAGLHYYNSLDSLKESKGDNLKRHSEISGNSG